MGISFSSEYFETEFLPNVERSLNIGLVIILRLSNLSLMLGVHVLLRDVYLLILAVLRVYGII